MALQLEQQRKLEQLGCVEAGSGVGIHAMKCASVSLLYNRVHCAVAGKISESSSSSNNDSNPFDDAAASLAAGPAGSSGLSAARQRVPWPRP